MGDTFIVKNGLAEVNFNVNGSRKCGPHKLQNVLDVQMH